MSPATRRTGWRRWWPLVLLCVLAAMRWIVAELAPEAGPSSATLCVGTFSAAVVAMTLATNRRTPLPRARTLAASAVAGALMICGPFAAMVLHASTIEASSLTIALALTPVVIAVARPGFRQTEGAELVGRTWPGLAAVAGLLLILPQPELNGWREVAVLALAPLAAGVGAAWLRTRNADAVWRAAAALLAAGVVFAIAATWHALPLRQVLLGGALDGVLMGLSVVALFRVGMTRWSAQFTVVPLVVLLEGLATMRPSVDSRIALGLALVALASVFLLLPPPPEDKPSLRG